MGRLAVIAAVALLGGIHLSAADADCNFYAVGQNLSLSFDLTLTSRDGLKWTHNGTAVYLRQPSGTVTTGKADDVSPTGSLLLKNLQLSSAGVYEATLLQPNHLKTEPRTWRHRVCVVDAVTKPQLTYVCDFKSGAVVLHCKVPSPQALVFSWTLGTSMLQKETRPTLSLPLGRLKGGSVTCAVENKASNASSDAVLPACKSPTPPPPAQVCLPLKALGAALAGGGGLVLVLLIVIVVLCCRHKRTKARMRSGNKVELRLASANKQEVGSVSYDYETMHTTEDYPGPSPQPSPRACKKSGSEFEGGAENKPLRASPAEGEQRPSPVPKPRTKLTQAPDV